MRYVYVIIDNDNELRKVFATLKSAKAYMKEIGYTQTDSMCGDWIYINGEYDSAIERYKIET